MKFDNHPTRNETLAEYDVRCKCILLDYVELLEVDPKI
jgi:hypothetical protein